MDPVLIALVVACAQGISRLVDALAQRWVLRARAELVKVAAEVSVSVQISGQDRHGGAWRIQAGPTPGSPEDE